MSEVVCYCFDVRKDKIVAAIENGCRSVDEVKDLLGVTGSCAGCQPDIEALIEFYGKYPEAGT